MNGRVSKLVRKVYANKSEARAFRKAYRDASPRQRVEALKVARKIAEMRKGGKEVNLFRINPETHQVEQVKGGDDEHKRVGDNHTSDASLRKEIDETPGTPTA